MRCQPGVRPCGSDPIALASQELAVEIQTYGAKGSDPQGLTPTPMASRHDNRKTGPSQRQLRVGELMRHALAEMLARGQIRDDVLASHAVTVSEVRMSSDLRLATIYIVPLGGKELAPVLAALDRNRKFIRGEIAHAVNLKFAPEIRFLADETFDEVERIDRLLASDKVRRDLEK